MNQSDSSYDTYEEREHCPKCGGFLKQGFYIGENSEEHYTETCNKKNCNYKYDGM